MRESPKEKLDMKFLKLDIKTHEWNNSGNKHKVLLERLILALIEILC